MVCTPSIPRPSAVNGAAIDADYATSLADLLKLQWELKHDGIDAALEKSRRSLHDFLRLSLPQLFPDWAAVQVWTQLDPGPLTALLRNELPRVHPAFRMTDVTLQSTLADTSTPTMRTEFLLRTASPLLKFNPSTHAWRRITRPKVSPVLGGRD